MKSVAVVIGLNLSDAKFSDDFQLFFLAQFIPSAIRFDQFVALCVLEFDLELHLGLRSCGLSAIVLGPLGVIGKEAVGPVDALHHLIGVRVTRLLQVGESLEGVGAGRRLKARWVTKEPQRRSVFSARCGLSHGSNRGLASGLGYFIALVLNPITWPSQNTEFEPPL